MCSNGVTCPTAMWRSTVRAANAVSYSIPGPQGMQAGSRVLVVVHISFCIGADYWLAALCPKNLAVLSCIPMLLRMLHPVDVSKHLHTFSAAANVAAMYHNTCSYNLLVLYRIIPCRWAGALAHFRPYGRHPLHYKGHQMTS